MTCIQSVIHFYDDRGEITYSLKICSEAVTRYVEPWLHTTDETSKYADIYRIPAKELCIHLLNNAYDCRLKGEQCAWLDGNKDDVCDYRIHEYEKCIEVFGCFTRKNGTK